MYSLEASRIKEALKESKITMEHFGSTSVSGMIAKPVIDILLGIEEFPPKQDLIQKIIALGYQCLGESGVSGRYYFRNRVVEQNFNIAVVLVNGELWTSNLLLRDYLRLNTAEAKAYSELKQEILKSGTNRLIEYSEKNQTLLRIF